MLGGRSGAGLATRPAKPPAASSAVSPWRVLAVVAIAAIALFSVFFSSQLSPLRGRDQDLVIGPLRSSPVLSPNVAAPLSKASPCPGPALLGGRHDAELRLPLPDGPALNAVAAMLAEDAWTPKLLAVMLDLIRRRMPELDVITSGGPDAGLYVSGASELRTGVAVARARLGADCRRDDILPVSCVITSGESAFIQEFLAWHLLLGWAHFLVVADVREPRPAHLRAALRPFIDAGFVSLAHVRSVEAAGGSNQRLAMEVCVEVLQKQGCAIKHSRPANVTTTTRGGGPGVESEQWGTADGAGVAAEEDAGSEEAAWQRHAGLLGSALQTGLDRGAASVPDACKAASPPNWQQRLWLAGGDDDEYYYVRDFPYATALAPLPPGWSAQDEMLLEGSGGGSALLNSDATHMCIPRFLRQYYGRGAVIIERLFYGGRYVQAHPQNRLVTEVYKHRWRLCSDLGKMLAQVWHLDEVNIGGHAVTYARAGGKGLGMVDSLGRPMSNRIMERRPVAPAPKGAAAAGGVTAAHPPLPPGSPNSPLWPPVAVAHFFGRSVERALLKYVRGVASMNRGGSAAPRPAAAAATHTPPRPPKQPTRAPAKGAAAAAAAAAAEAARGRVLLEALAAEPATPGADGLRALLLARRLLATLEGGEDGSQLAEQLPLPSLLPGSDAKPTAAADGDGPASGDSLQPDQQARDEAVPEGMPPAPAAAGTALPTFQGSPAAPQRFSQHAIEAPAPAPPGTALSPAEAALVAQRAVDASLDTMAHRMYAPSLVMKQSLEYGGSSGGRLFDTLDPLPAPLVQAARVALGLPAVPAVPAARGSSGGGSSGALGS